MAELSVANGLLGNAFRDTVAPYYHPFYSASTVNAYSGTVVNPYLGDYGALVLEGGGHADSNDNSVHVLDIGRSSCAFRRVTDPTPLFGQGSDNATRLANSRSSGEVTPLTDFIWCEYQPGGQPVARHSYGAQDVLGPEHGGAKHGSFYRVLVTAGAFHGGAAGEVAHRLDFTSTSGLSSWQRAGTTPGVSGPPGTPGQGLRAGPPIWTCFVPAQGRIYMECGAQAGLVPPRWFDLASRSYVLGSGTARRNDSDGPDNGSMFHVPERNLLILADCYRGALRLRTMDLHSTQPSWVNAARPLSLRVAVADSWSAACWCPDNQRILVGNVAGDPAAVYEIEIPADPAQTWTVTRAPLPSGQTIRWAPSTTYKKWSYNPRVRAVMYLPYADRDGQDVVYVYRPRGT